MKTEYISRLEKIEAALLSCLPENADPLWVERVFPGVSISPILVQTLIEPGFDMLCRGGKRWRPLLMTLVCEALGGGDNALPLTPLVEIPHNASLIHDDIEDNSTFRRGKPAVHIRYGIDTAINSGSFMYFLPLFRLDSWDASAEQKNGVFKLWAEIFRRLHLGQAMDIAWHREGAAIPSLEDYDLMCRLKTGSLVRFAAMLGAAAAGYTGAPASIFGDAAEKFGVGFQILDDVKNLTTGNPGKKRGDDIVEGKKSLPVLLYLQKNRSFFETVTRCFAEAHSAGVDSPSVEELIMKMQQSGAISEAAERGQSLIEEARSVFAMKTIGDVSIDPICSRMLTGLTDLLSSAH